MSTDKDKNPKTKNAPSLWLFFSFNLALLLTSYFANNFSQLTSDFHSILNIRSTSVLISPLILFIVNGFLSSDQKAILVFWKSKDTLPGCRAFSVYGPKDYRVDMSKVQSKHGPLPVVPIQQNQLWYKLFKLHKNDSMVFTSHQQYLLARDLTTIAFLFMIFAGIPFLLLGKYPLNWFYLVLMVLQYLVTAIVAQNYGKRFVTNVLAVDCTNIKS